MAARVTPNQCPDCGQSFDIKYSTYRHAKMQQKAMLIVIAGCVVSAALTIVAFDLLVPLIADWTQQAGLLRKERGMLLALACAVVIPLMWIPGWIACRIGFRIPRVLAYRCANCPWTGNCLIDERAKAPRADENPNG